MAVLPESMNRLGPDPEKNFRTLEQYIRYMAERLEFSMAGMGRTVSGAGVSTASLALELREVRNGLSAVQGALNTITGDVNGLKTGLAELNSAVSTLQTGTEELNGAMSALQTRITALEDRVSALEG